ncbi:hypothetical protein DL764_001004 [Monosporascus ibericus]|uniref:Uncharacterized protein n=1 Tax=Monosporascus ibericus TaxID=155417 RepID=A0A4Q4TW61_9PEZI|nr:hypothetical protein DL764_001004 [Monosporascus ibericus]
MDSEMSAPGPEAHPKLPPKGRSLEESKQTDEGKDRLIDGITPTPSIHPNGHESSTASGTDPISRIHLRQTDTNDVTQLDRVTNRFPVRQGESLRAISPSLDAKKLQSQLAEREENTRRVLEELQKEKQDLREAHQELSGSYEAIIRTLKLELKEAKADLEDTRSHILSMQPYVKDTTPEEIVRDFDDLYDAVCNWVETWMTPVFDSDEYCSEILSNARKSPLRAAELKSMVLYGSVTQYTEMLQVIEDSMRGSVQPKRDLFAVRNWRAESYTSLLNHPGFSAVRDTRRVEITKELWKLFLPLVPKTVKHRVFQEGLDRKIVGPALELQEKIRCSIHYYWFTLNQYEGPSYGAVSDHVRASTLLAELDEVDCEDVFGNRRRWDPAKLRNPPSQEDVLHKLYPICTLSPRLIMQQVGRGEIVKEPRIIRKQRTLVAWATPETRASRLADEPPTLMNAIYSMRQPRSNGAGGIFSAWF